MSTLTTAKVSYTIAFIDMVLALLSALCGSAYCVGFALLGGVMLAHGMYYQTKAEKEGE